MEVTQELAVSPEEFFDFLYQSIVLDVKENTGKNVKPENITEGMTYSKKLQTQMGQTGEATVKLAVWQPNTNYVAEFNSNQGKNIISYTIEKIADDRIRVRYQEDFVAAGRLKAWNFKFMNLFFKRSSKKQATERLKQIENYLQTERKNPKNDLAAG